MTLSENEINGVLLPAVSASNETEYLTATGHTPDDGVDENRVDALNEETPDDDAEIDALTGEIDVDDVDQGYDDEDLAAVEEETL